MEVMDLSIQTHIFAIIALVAFVALNLYRLFTQADFFKLRDEIQSEITKKANHINKMNKKIKNLEKKNKKLLKDLTNLENDNAASSGMLNDIQLRYNEYLLGNWILFISLIGVVTLYYKKRA